MRGDGRLLDEKIKLGHLGQELENIGRTFWVGVSERQNTQRFSRFVEAPMNR